MSALNTILTTVSRLGCRVTAVLAAELSVEIALVAPARVACRVARCLEQIIEVLAIAEAAGFPFERSLDCRLSHSEKESAS